MSDGQHGEADLGRSDIEALGATRAELGKDYEDALLDSFADRVEATIDARVNRELVRRGAGHVPASTPYGGQVQPATGNGPQLALGIISTVALIPITITLGVTGNWFPLVIAIAAILGVNYAHVLHYKFQKPDSDPRRR